MVDAVIEDEDGEVLWAVSQTCVLGRCDEAGLRMGHDENFISLTGEVKDHSRDIRLLVQMLAPAPSSDAYTDAATRDEHCRLCSVQLEISASALEAWFGRAPPAMLKNAQAEWRTSIEERNRWGGDKCRW